MFRYCHLNHMIFIHPGTHPSLSQFPGYWHPGLTRIHPVPDLLRDPPGSHPPRFCTGKFSMRNQVRGYHLYTPNRSLNGSGLCDYPGRIECTSILPDRNALVRFHSTQCTSCVLTSSIKCPLHQLDRLCMENWSRTNHHCPELTIPCLGYGKKFFPMSLDRTVHCKIYTYRTHRWVLPVPIPFPGVIYLPSHQLLLSIVRNVCSGA